jgi:hypothetical protein
MVSGSWIEDLLEILCKLYKFWGGKDCSVFGGDPHTAVTVMVGTYAKDGAPVFATPAAKADFLALLDALEALLALPGNSLSGADNLALITLIADLRKDIG